MEKRYLINNPFIDKEPYKAESKNEHKINVKKTMKGIGRDSLYRYIDYDEKEM